MSEPRKDFKWAALVPELVCSDLASSHSFYLETLGFSECYARDGFCYLEIGEAQLMLEQGPSDWITGSLHQPYGRGINLQIEVGEIDPILNRLAARSHPLFMERREQWYRAGNMEHGQREFIVQDPDGYLLRFCENLGERAIPS